MAPPMMRSPPTISNVPMGSPRKTSAQTKAGVGRTLAVQRFREYLL